jgi:hypothetical protein
VSLKTEEWELLSMKWISKMHNEGMPEREVPQFP